MTDLAMAYIFALSHGSAWETLSGAIRYPLLNDAHQMEGLFLRNEREARQFRRDAYRVPRSRVIRTWT